eukprot:PITA_22960
MEEVYIEKPLGYEMKGEEHKVCKLKKALYGLKQVPRAWYSRIDSYLLENGFEKCEGEPTVYIKEKDGKLLIVVLYVDDVIFTGNDDYLIENFKAVVKEEFEMTDMGLLRYFLGIEVDQNKNGIFISQAKYVNEVLGGFNMQECKTTITPTVMGLKLSKEDSNKDFDPSLYKSDRERTSGYAFHMGSGAISWASKKESIVALSTTEAKYVAATVATC